MRSPRRDGLGDRDQDAGDEVRERPLGREAEDEADDRRRGEHPAGDGPHGGDGQERGEDADGDDDRRDGAPEDAIPRGGDGVERALAMWPSTIRAAITAARTTPAAIAMRSQSIRRCSLRVERASCPRTPPRSRASSRPAPPQLPAEKCLDALDARRESTSPVSGSLTTPPRPWIALTQRATPASSASISSSSRPSSRESRPPPLPAICRPSSARCAALDERGAMRHELLGQRLDLDQQRVDLVPREVARRHGRIIETLVARGQRDWTTVDAVTIDAYGTLLELRDPAGSLARVLPGFERDSIERAFRAEVEHTPRMPSRGATPSRSRTSESTAPASSTRRSAPRSARTSSSTRSSSPGWTARATPSNGCAPVGSRSRSSRTGTSRCTIGSTTSASRS